MAWSDAARRAAALARKAKGRRPKGRVPTVGENRDEMMAILHKAHARGEPWAIREAARHASQRFGEPFSPRVPSPATRAAMIQGEMRNPSFALYGNPKPGMVEAAHGVYQRRDEFAKTLKAARAEVRARSSETTAKGRNLHARVIAGRTVQALLQRRR